MVTIPEVVKTIIKKSPYLEESLSLGIINLSALARLIKPDVERRVMKSVQQGAVIMALKRISEQIKAQTQRTRLFDGLPNIMVRSNLFVMTFEQREDFIEKEKQLLTEIKGKRHYFLTVTQGIYETTIAASQELKPKVLSLFQKNKIMSQIDNLSSINIRLPENSPVIPGIYSYILKFLAWENISVVEVVSTCNEFSIILRDEDIGTAFSVLKQALHGQTQ
jgi:hypothetical protein